jgi:hypothetical protein
VAELSVVRAVPIIKVRARCCLGAAAAMTSGDKFSSRSFLWVVEDWQRVAARRGCEAAAAPPQPGAEGGRWAVPEWWPAGEASGAEVASSTFVEPKLKMFQNKRRP